jgi:hypothetical protein
MTMNANLDNHVIHNAHRLYESCLQILVLADTYTESTKLVIDQLRCEAKDNDAEDAQKLALALLLEAMVGE